MRSIGNDIVALKAINKQRSTDARFYSKFITRSEQALYQQLPVNSMPFENYVWLLWSVKESAYKYLKRTDPDLVFAPSKITVKQLDIPAEPLAFEPWGSCWEGNASGGGFYTGQLVNNADTLYFRSVINTELITSIVTNDPSFENVYFGIQLIRNNDHENQSRSVRELLLTRLKSVLPYADLTIGKSDSGYPLVLYDGKDLNIPVSLAHHEQVVAYCCYLPGSHDI